jgi:hypothetical protein
MLGRTSRLAALLIFAVLFQSSNASARVGETRAECDHRYGEASELELKVGPILEDEAEKWEASVYSARGLTIEVIFENDRAVFVRYSNQPVLSLGSYDRAAHSLTQKEIDYLKRANAGKGVRWRRHVEPILEDYAPTVTVWKTADGRFFSGYDREGNRLFVCNSVFWDKVIGRIRESAGVGNRGDSAAHLEGL